MPHTPPIQESSLRLPPEVELVKLKKNITGFAYVNDIKQHAAESGFDFGFTEGTLHAAKCLLEYIKENKLNKEDFRLLIEKIICTKLKSSNHEPTRE